MSRRALALVLGLAVMSGLAHSAAAESTEPALRVEATEMKGEPVLGNSGGVLLRFVERGRFALGLRVRNGSQEALTIVDVRTHEPAGSLVRQVGVRFAPWEKPQCPPGLFICPAGVFRLSLSATPSPQPAELAPEGTIGVELNYVLGSCTEIATASAAPARWFEVRYRDGAGSLGSVKLPIGSDGMRLRMPKPRDCSADPRSEISVSGQRMSTSSWWTVPGSAGDLCTRTARGELLFESRRFELDERVDATEHVLIRLPKFQGPGLYRSLHASARALGPARVLVAVRGRLGTLSVFHADRSIVTVLRDEPTRLGGRFSATGDGPRGQRFSVRGEWRCTTTPS
jgi:hypothetical protein